MRMFAKDPGRLPQQAWAIGALRSICQTLLLLARVMRLVCFRPRPAFRVFPQTRAIRRGTRRAYRFARKYAHQRNRVALAADSQEAEQSDSCRSTPMRQKTPARVRRI